MVHTNFWLIQILGLRQFWVQNILFSENNLCPKNFRSKNIFGWKKFLSPKIFLINLSFPDLTCPDLTWLDLTCLDLTFPDLTCPDFTYPDLTCPDLTCPDLTSLDLTFSDFTFSDYLTWLNLSRLNLSSSWNLKFAFKPFKHPLFTL